jgi:uncharacterized protein (TIGR02246 family)
MTAAPLVAVALLAAAPFTPQAAITAAMTDSAAGWNAGNLDRFMAVYADNAIYVTTGGLVRGKAAIADRYRPSFTNGGNARGRLSFRMLGDRRIDATHHILFAQWILMGGVETTSGMTTLVFERRGASWRIVADHSS